MFCIVHSFLLHLNNFIHIWILNSHMRMYIKTRSAGTVCVWH